MIRMHKLLTQQQWQTLKHHLNLNQLQYQMLSTWQPQPRMSHFPMLSIKPRINSCKLYLNMKHHFLVMIDMEDYSALFLLPSLLLLEALALYRFHRLDFIHRKEYFHLGFLI